MQLPSPKTPGPQVCDRPRLARWLFSHIPLLIANQTAHQLLIALVSRDRVTLLSQSSFTLSSLYSCARQVSWEQARVRCDIIGLMLQMKLAGVAYGLTYFIVVPTMPFFFRLDNATVSGAGACRTGPGPGQAIAMPFKAAVELAMAYWALQLVRSIRATAKTRGSTGIGLCPEAVAQRQACDTNLPVCVLVDAALALVGSPVDSPLLSCSSKASPLPLFQAHSATAACAIIALAQFNRRAGEDIDYREVIVALRKPPPPLFQSPRRSKSQRCCWTWRV